MRKRVNAVSTSDKDALISAEKLTVESPSSRRDKDHETDEDGLENEDGVVEPGASPIFHQFPQPYRPSPGLAG
jgi:hypothetical protein